MRSCKIFATAPKVLKKPGLLKRPSAAQDEEPGQVHLRKKPAEEEAILQENAAGSSRVEPSGRAASSSTLGTGSLLMRQGSSLHVGA